MRDQLDSKHTDDSLAAEKWSESDIMVNKALLDIIENTKEGVKLAKMKRDLENDIEYMKKKLNGYNSIQVSPNDQKIWDENLEELAKKLEQKMNVAAQLNITPS